MKQRSTTQNFLYFGLRDLTICGIGNNNKMISEGFWFALMISIIKQHYMRSGWHLIRKPRLACTVIPKGKTVWDGCHVPCCAWMELFMSVTALFPSGPQQTPRATSEIIQSLALTYWKSLTLNNYHNKKCCRNCHCRRQTWLKTHWLILQTSAMVGLQYYLWFSYGLVWVGQPCRTRVAALFRPPTSAWLTPHYCNCHVHPSSTPSRQRHRRFN